MTGQTHPSRPSITAPSLLIACLLHMRIALRRLLQVRSLAPALGLLLLTLLGGAGLAHVSPGDVEVHGTFFSSVVLRVVAVLALGYGTAAVRGDADRGALGIFLLRPRAAIALPLGRLAAIASVVAAIALAITLLLHVAVLLFGMPPDLAGLPWQLLAASLAALSYTAIFMWLASLFKRAAPVSIAYLVLLDMGLSNLSARLALLAPHHSLTLIATTDPSAAGMGGDVGLAIVHLAGLSIVASIALVWRFRGDLPT